MPTTLKCTFVAFVRSPSSPVRCTLQAESAANLRTLFPSATPAMATTLSSPGASLVHDSANCPRTAPFSHWKTGDTLDCRSSDRTTPFCRSTSFRRSRWRTSSSFPSSSSSISATLIICSYFFRARDSLTLRPAVSSGNCVLNDSTVSPTGTRNRVSSSSIPNDTATRPPAAPFFSPRRAFAIIHMALEVSFSSNTLCSCIAV